MKVTIDTSAIKVGVLRRFLKVISIIVLIPTWLFYSMSFYLTHYSKDSPSYELLSQGGKGVFIITVMSFGIHLIIGLISFLFFLALKEPIIAVKKYILTGKW